MSADARVLSCACCPHPLYGAKSTSAGNVKCQYVVGPGMSRHRFICMDCGQDTGRMHEYYFVHTRIWMAATAGSPDGMLCIGCLEGRIGRKLTARDFTRAYINRPGYSAQSARLLNRLLAEE